MVPVLLVLQAAVSGSDPRFGHDKTRRLQTPGTSAPSGSVGKTGSGGMTLSRYRHSGEPCAAGVLGKDNGSRRKKPNLRA